MGSGQGITDGGTAGGRYPGSTGIGVLAPAISGKRRQSVQGCSPLLLAGRMGQAIAGPACAPLVVLKEWSAAPPDRDEGTGAASDAAARLAPEEGVASASNVTARPVSARAAILPDTGCRSLNLFISETLPYWIIASCRVLMTMPME